MTTSAPLLEEWFKAAFDSAMLDVHTALPCKVDSYDPTTQTVDVKPLIKRSIPKADGTFIHESLPTIPGIPLALPRWGTWFMSAPIAVGDFVFVIFSDSALGQFRSKGMESESGDIRRHALDGAVAFPANVYPTANALSSVHAANLVLGKDDGAQIHIKPTGEIDLYEENAAEFVALATKVLTELQSIQTQVNTLITTFNANVAVFAAHIHSGVTPGGGVTGTTATPMTPGISLTAPQSVASAHVKAT